jgi:S-adenosylmethionine synthetase
VFKIIFKILKNINDYNFFSDLELRTPFYQQTSTYGHFGRDGFPWEKPKTLIVD